MCTGRNTQKVCVGAKGSLAALDMCTGRNPAQEWLRWRMSLAALDMCTGRNCYERQRWNAHSLAALDMCTGRNSPRGCHEKPDESSGLGYVHWPEQTLLVVESVE